MRKIIALIAIVLGLSSCDHTPTKSVRSIDDIMSVTALHFTSEEHQYISFVINNNFAGTVHDPECWCMVDYE